MLYTLREKRSGWLPGISTQTSSLPSTILHYFSVTQNNIESGNDEAAKEWFNFKKYLLLGLFLRGLEASCYFQVNESQIHHLNYIDASQPRRKHLFLLLLAFWSPAGSFFICIDTENSDKCFLLKRKTTQEGREWAGYAFYKDDLREKRSALYKKSMIRATLWG